MLISTELLNIHNGVTWEREFGLTASDLTYLILPLAKQVSLGMQAQSAYICLFEDRVPLEIEIGSTSHQKSVFKQLRALVDVKVGRFLLTEKTNNILLSKLNQSVAELNVTSCLIVDIFAPKEGIKGFACLFGNTLTEQDNVMSSLSSLFVSSCIQSLLAKKYARLNQERDEFFQLVVNTNQHPIFAKDEYSKLVFANQAFIDLYPLEKQNKIIGYTTVEDYSEEQRELFLKDDKEAFASGQKVVVEHINFPNGEQKTLETTKRRFKTNTGKQYILGVAYNITDKYRLIEILKRKNRDLDYIANLLVTDIRLPSNALVKLIKWLEEDLSTANYQDVDATVLEIKQRITRLNKLISSLHKYCFAGRDKHIKSELSLTDLVAEILASINTKKIINTHIDDAVIRLPIISIQGVLKELIKNAVDFCDNEPITLDVSCHSDNENYYFEIKDNGVGINSDYIDKAFELFESSKNVATDNVYGLGLAVARKTVESYDGRLIIDSEFVNGTKVNVIWPK